MFDFQYNWKRAALPGSLWASWRGLDGPRSAARFGVRPGISQDLRRDGPEKLN